MQRLTSFCETPRPEAERTSSRRLEPVDAACETTHPPVFGRTAATSSTVCSLVGARSTLDAKRRKIVASGYLRALLLRQWTSLFSVRPILISPRPVDYIAQRRAIEIGAQIVAEHLDGAVAVVVALAGNVRRNQNPRVLP